MDNYQQKQEKRKKIRETFISPYSEGCVKITSGESELHARVKALLVHFLKVNNYDCWTEVNFVRPYNGRADILALNDSGYVYVFEVMVSETEKKLLNKKYPFPIIPIITKDFKYEDFKL